MTIKPLDLLLGAALLAALAGAAGRAGGAELSLHAVVGTVNGEPLTLHDLSPWAGPALAEAAALHQGEARTEALRRRFEEARDDRLDLLLIEAEVKADPRLEDLVKAAAADVQAYEEELRKNLGVKTEKELADLLGTKVRELRLDREMGRLTLLRARYLARVSGPVDVAPREVLAWYEAHAQDFARPQEARFRMILLPWAEFETKADARRKAAGVGEELAKGVDFAHLARLHSKDPYAAQGGDFGFRRKGTLHEEYDRAIFSTPPGGRKGPIETPEGIAFIKVEERRGGGVAPVEEAQEEIRGRLLQEAFRKGQEETLSALRSKAVIERYPVQDAWIEALLKARGGSAPEPPSDGPPPAPSSPPTTP